MTQNECNTKDGDKSTRKVNENQHNTSSLIDRQMGRMTEIQ